VRVCVCVCMCVCVCVCVCVYIYTERHNTESSRANLPIIMFVKYVCILVRMCVCVCVCGLNPKETQRPKLNPKLKTSERPP
jgi:L-asparagine transporter-like permease